MTRVLLLLLFFVLLAADTLGMNLSLAPGLSVKNAFLYLILVGIAIEAAVARNRKIELLSGILPYVLCTFYALFTWLVVVTLIDYPGFNGLRAFIALKSQLGDHLVVFLAFFYGLQHSKDSIWLLKMMVWIVIIGNVITVVDGLNMPDLGLIHERENGRIGGPIGEANQYAAFLVLFLPAAVGLALLERGLRRKLAMFGVAVSGIALLMTVSRGGLVGIVGGSTLAAVFLREFISARHVMSVVGGLFLIGVVSLGALLMGGYGDLLYERFVEQTFSGDSQTVSSGRSVIWSTALYKMFEQPLSLITGYGWGAYNQFPDFRYSPHNVYLRLFFELGLIGLSLVLLAFTNLLRLARQGLRQADSESGVLLFTFVFGFFGVLVTIFFVDLFSPWLFIWAYIGAAMRLVMALTDTSAARSSEMSFSAGRHAEPAGVI